MAAILNSAILNLAILDSAILEIPLKLTHTCQDWFPTICTKTLHSHFPSYHLHKGNFTHSLVPTICTKKLHSLILTQLDDGSHFEICHLGFSHFSQKNFTHAFSLNLMMAAILNSAILDSDTAILDSDTLLSSLRFTQKHSHSTLTWTNSIWLKLIHSHLIGDGSHLDLCHFVFSHLSFPSQTHSHLPRLVPTICTKKPTLIHSDSTWWWQPSWILPSWIQPFCTKKLHSCILTELDDGSHLEFYHVWFIHCHLAFRHLHILSQIHSKTLSLYSDPASN